MGKIIKLVQKACCNLKRCPVFVFQFEEEEELALIFLQKVIRGRAIQNMVSYLGCLVRGSRSPL